MAKKLKDVVAKPGVAEYVVDLGRLTASLNALADIEEEADAPDYATASYNDLRETLKRCRRIARVALGKEEGE